MLIGRARCRPKCQGACPGHPVDVGRPEFRCDDGGYLKKMGPLLTRGFFVRLRAC